MIMRDSTGGSSKYIIVGKIDFPESKRFSYTLFKENKIIRVTRKITWYKESCNLLLHYQ